jgi:hypothetical protein
MYEEDWGNALKESFFELKWESHDDPTLFRFCRVIGNISKYIPSGSEFMKSHLHKIAGFVLDFSNKPETMKSILSAINYLANSTAYVKVMSREGVFQKLAEKLINNKSSATKHHLILALHRLLSFQF